MLSMLQLGLSNQLKHLLSYFWLATTCSCSSLPYDFKALLCNRVGLMAVEQQPPSRAAVGHLLGWQPAYCRGGGHGCLVASESQGLLQNELSGFSKWRFHIFGWNLHKITDGNATNPITWATVKYLIPSMKPTMKCSCCAISSREQELLLLKKSLSWMSAQVSASCIVKMFGLQRKFMVLLACVSLGV